MGKFRARPEPLLYGNFLINHRLFKHIIKLSFPRGEKHWVLVRLDSSMKRFQPKIELLFWLSALVSFCLSVHFSLPAVTVGNGQIPCFGLCSITGCFQLSKGAGGTEGRLVCGEAGLVNPSFGVGSVLLMER